MNSYTAALVGCSRMGAFIDNEKHHTARILSPYSHAAGYAASDHTKLIACADLRVDVMEQFGEIYNVPKGHQYTDFRELIDEEKPDILSVATQPEQRAEIIIYAAEHGIKAIYAEKAMAASMEQVDSIVSACNQNGVVFNLGTNRRWDPGFDAMKNIIDSGDLGRLESILVHSTGQLFNIGSHNFDLAMRMNSDIPGAWVQGRLIDDDLFRLDGTLSGDPVGEGTIQFENGVTCYAMNTSHANRYEVVCEKGIITTISDPGVKRTGEVEFQVLIRDSNDKGHNYHYIQKTFMDRPFPKSKNVSSTLLLIEDLVHSLDTGEAPRGGTNNARSSTELIFGIIESHKEGGRRVELPLSERITSMSREFAPRQPKYEP